MAGFGGGNEDKLGYLEIFFRDVLNSNQIALSRTD